MVPYTHLTFLYCLMVYTWPCILYDDSKTAENLCKSSLTVDGLNTDSRCLTLYLLVGIYSWVIPNSLIWNYSVKLYLILENWLLNQRQKKIVSGTVSGEHAHQQDSNNKNRYFYTSIWITKLSKKPPLLPHILKQPSIIQ